MGLLIGSDKDPEECDCPCHEMPGVKHCMPCCDTCSECGKHISFGFMDMHKDRHRQEREQAEEITRKILDGGEKKDK